MQATTTVTKIDFGTGIVEKINKMNLKLVRLASGRVKIINPRLEGDVLKGAHVFRNGEDSGLAYGEQWELWNEYRSQYKFTFADQNPDFFPELAESDEGFILTAHDEWERPEEHSQALACVWPRTWKTTDFVMPRNLPTARSAGYDRVFDVALGEPMNSTQLLKSAEKSARYNYKQWKDEKGRTVTAPRFSHTMEGLEFQEDMEILREIFEDTNEGHLYDYAQSYEAHARKCFEDDKPEEGRKALAAARLCNRVIMERINTFEMNDVHDGDDADFNPEPKAFRSEVEYIDWCSKKDLPAQREWARKLEAKAAAKAKAEESQRPVRRKRSYKPVNIRREETFADGRRRIVVA